MQCCKIRRLEIRKWERREGYARVWSKNDESYAADNAVVIAAKYGQLDVLQWLRENGCPWNAVTCSAAAEGGHLSCLQWRRENGCPWNFFTCSAAASGGHLSCLRWARENGCVWDVTTCDAAAMAAVSPASNGQKRMDVHGTKKHVLHLRDAAI